MRYIRANNHRNSILKSLFTSIITIVDAFDEKTNVVHRIATTTLMIALISRNLMLVIIKLMFLIFAL